MKIFSLILQIPMEELMQSYDADSQEQSNDRSVDEQNISFFIRLQNIA